MEKYLSTGFHPHQLKIATLQGYAWMTAKQASTDIPHHSVTEGPGK